MTDTWECARCGVGQTAHAILQTKCIWEPVLIEAVESAILKRDAAEDMYCGGNRLNALIQQAQNFLATYIVPDSGISEHDAVSELLGIFDGPEQRAAQSTWAAARAKADGKVRA